MGQSRDTLRRQSIREQYRALIVSASLIPSMSLVGCGFARVAQISSVSGSAIKGHVYGGQQPVTGASIVLYAAGSSGVGVGATVLITGGPVRTDSAGNFSITGDYTCPSNTTQVYIVSQGGNPGLPAGQTNSAITLIAALGDCGSLSSSTYITINEVTTAAAAWSLAQFAGPNAGIGSSATNATGLRNAFSTAANLASSSDGTSPGAALPSGAVTETAKLYTLADAIASCVNSDGGSACDPLFSAATVSGAVPSNTFDAALNIVRHPSTNVSSVYRAAGTRGPFQPTLYAAPNDWTISITYSGGGLNLPGALAVDSLGNVIVADYFGGVYSKFSPAGVPAAAAGYHGIGLRESYGIAVDPSDNVWVTNEQSVTAANNSHLGSISEFTSAGVEISGSGFTSGGVYYPQAAASMPNGDMWIADYGSSSATLLGPGGSAISPSPGFGNAALPFTSAVAVDSIGNGWFAVQTGVVRVTPAGSVSHYTCCQGPAGIAVDLSGNVWVADYNGSAVVELSSAGVILQQTTLNGGNAGPQGIAVDGAGNIWVANYYGNSIATLSGSTASLLTPSSGLGLDTLLDEPYGLAVDSSGNVWLSNAGSNSLTELVGAAAPVRTPSLGPAVQP